jgi:hypothetical protein
MLPFAVVEKAFVESFFSGFLVSFDGFESFALESAAVVARDWEL